MYAAKKFKMMQGTDQMEFISKNGTRFIYRVTVGDVINVTSWWADGARHHGIWIRNCDGHEWHCEGFPLGVNVTKGQRIAFGLCSTQESNGARLVAVRNCSSGVGNVLSPHIAIAMGVHRYGRNAFYGLASLAAFAQLAYWLLVLPDWVPHISFVTLACGVLGGSALGLLVSCLRDSDPERVIDTGLRNALDGVQYGVERTRSTSGGAASRVKHHHPGHAAGLAR